MKKLQGKTKKTIKISLLSIVAILAVLVIGFLIFVSDYYRADELALSLLENNSEIQVVDNLTILSPNTSTDTGLIFYPGAKVEAIAYLPMLDQLKESGIEVIIVEMPFNMAIFNSNAADKIFEDFPHIKKWYIGGHSMGGAMASSYASKNPDKVEGLILLGAYVYGDYPPEKSLTVYGTFNSDLEKNIDYKENIVVIQGGNHAKFGNYGKQKGDPLGTISRKEQQDIAVDAILKFVE